MRKSKPLYSKYSVGSRATAAVADTPAFPRGHVDVDAEGPLAARFGVQSIPTVAVFRDGEPVTGLVGAYPAPAIATFFDELLAEEAAAA